MPDTAAAEGHPGGLARGGGQEARHHVAGRCLRAAGPGSHQRVPPPPTHTLTLIYMYMYMYTPVPPADTV